MPSVAWITGGGTGIGRAVAEALHREGAHVVITGRRQEVLEKAAKEIAAESGAGEVLAVAGDAADPAHVRDVISQAQKRWGDIDLLVNNAGANLDMEDGWAPFERYQKSLDINLYTAIRAAEAVLPAMRKANRGAIVNISSVYGKWSSSRSPSYSVAKYALTGYTDFLRQALVDTQILVMGVFPGFIRTDMTLPYVKLGSIRSRIGKSPEQLADAILKALKQRKSEVLFPWYVSWLWRLHAMLPKFADRLAHHTKR